MALGGECDDYVVCSNVSNAIRRVHTSSMNELTNALLILITYALCVLSSLGFQCKI